ncbi:unnamed protein product [Clavelina lepadiformis]|uniref:Cns1/TTC4 wheel domain-containing protein n=1 Tax=Clavelina lepadiformis TaxID=159417 RepID=A0ABP0GJ02_CLALP
MAKSSKLTDAERHKLIEKLNKETEEFIKERQENNKDYVYKDGFTDENIDEILATHPAFMKSQPTAEEIENNPLLKGLQMIQYDPDDTPYEKAMAHKKDGNFQFKCKQYKRACLAYTEAIKAKCDDNDLMAVLYTNRAAANFRLQNYRSSLLDATYAVKLSPERVKSLLRCAHCCEAMKRYDDAMDWCKIVLSLDEENKEAAESLENCSKLKKVSDRDKRKEELSKEKTRKQNVLLLDTIKSHGVQLDVCENADDDDEVSTVISMFQSHGENNVKVHLNVDNDLVWPVFFAYPEFQITDFIEQFNENSTFFDHLWMMFDKPADWDVKGHYTSEHLVAFYENVGNRYD